MSASDAAPLPRLGEVFFDVRGDSRSMRLSWYADTGVAVFSIWQGGRCTGTFRLPMDDLPRMIEILQRGPQQQRRSPAGGRPEREKYEHGEYQPGDYGAADHGAGDYGAGDYGAGDYGAGDYGARDYGAGGHEDARYGPGGDDAAYGPGGYNQDGYDGAGYAQGGQGQRAFRPDEYAADEYAPDGDVSTSRRSGGGHRSAGYADPAGYPDVPGYADPGYADPGAGDRSRAGTSWSDLPTGTYSRQEDGYQPDEYRTDGYQGDGYQPGGYQPDGRQPAAYQSDTTDHSAAAETDLGGYGQERFVPPYVRTPGEAYPNDNPVPRRARRHGGSGPAYPADQAGVSPESQGYSPPPRSRPGYSDGSDVRLAADTAVSVRNSGGSHGSQETRSYRQSRLAEADLPMTTSQVSRRDYSGHEAR